MTAKELIAICLRSAVDNLFRSAQGMPEDKLNWRVGDQTRTPLELLQECAQSLKWPESLLSKPEITFDPEQYEQSLKERRAWNTIDLCENAARRNLEATLAYVRDYPDNDLDRKITLPFAQGIVVTVGEILLSPYWNCVYHLGQINFVQTMYGDTDMH